MEIDCFNEGSRHTLTHIKTADFSRRSRALAPSLWLIRKALVSLLPFWSRDPLATQGDVALHPRRDPQPPITLQTARYEVPMPGSFATLARQVAMGCEASLFIFVSCGPRIVDTNFVSRTEMEKSEARRFQVYQENRRFYGIC